MNQNGRPRLGWYTVDQIASVLGISEKFTYHLLMKHGVPRAQAKVADSEKYHTVVHVKDVWKMSDERDKALPHDRRRRRGPTDENFIMPVQLAETVATEELKWTVRRIRDIVNERGRRLPNGRPYNNGLVMFNLMANAASGILKQLEDGEKVWLEWEYVKVRKANKRPKRDMMMFPRPLDIPAWLFKPEN